MLIYAVVARKVVVVVSMRIVADLVVVEDSVLGGAVAADKVVCRKIIAVVSADTDLQMVINTMHQIHINQTFPHLAVLLLAIEIGKIAN